MAKRRTRPPATKPPSGATRLMLTREDGQWFATSGERVEVVLMPPLVETPTLICTFRVDRDGEAFEMFDGRQWVPFTDGFDNPDQPAAARVPGYCQRCRAKEVELYGTVLSTADDRHIRACAEVGCKHPPYYDVQ